MLRMQGYDEEDFLCLRLAIAADSGCDQRKRKRKESPAISDSTISDDQSYEEEGKILSLFQMRDQMLKLNHKSEDHESDEDGKGLHLIHLLLVAATSVDENNPTAAAENLRGLYRNASLTGDSVQRVAAYFADGLVARLLTRDSPFYDMIMKGPTPDEEFLSYMELYKVSPLYQLAHFTANEAILEAFEKQERANPNPNPRVLHVIDFDVSYGFQWPSLMQSLSDRATSASRILLKITGYSSCPEQLRETQSRLTSFARGISNLIFEFTGVVRGANLAKPKIKKGEIVAVNLAFHLNSLNSFCRISDTLNYIKSLHPAIVVLVEQEGSRKAHNFLSRFIESLHYFAAIFDSLDDCLPLDSSERLRIEKNHLGTEIKQVMNYDKDGRDNCLSFENLETWKKRMESHGFCGVQHSSNAVMQAKLLLKIRSHCSGMHFDGENGGFRVFERDDGRALSLGWQEKLLITASSWSCV